MILKTAAGNAKLILCSSDKNILRFVQVFNWAREAKHRICTQPIELLLSLCYRYTTLTPPLAWIDGQIIPLTIAVVYNSAYTKHA